MKVYNAIDCSVFIFILCVTIQQVFSYEIKSTEQCMKYLKRFGYMENSERRTSLQENDMKSSIQEFQKMMRINTTGELDTETMKLMNVKRCGNKDKGPDMMAFTKRDKRYVLEANGRVWRKRSLTYKITQHSKNKDLRSYRKTINEHVAKALRLWETASNIKFFYSKQLPVDIEIKFLSEKHDEDEYAFDGPGNTLAHAFAPGQGLGGDVHFDDQEMWDIIKDNNGSNFFWVALHELGHSLGLAHSFEEGSIMQPFSVDFNLDLQLHSDDVDAIQFLYGPPVYNPWEDSVPTVPTFESEEDELLAEEPLNGSTVSPVQDDENGVEVCPTHERPRPQPCSCPQMDGITTLSNGQIYAFKGSYAYRIDEKLGLTSSIHNIQFIFRDLKVNNVDAVLTTKDGNTYFFKEGEVWTVLEDNLLASAKPSEFSKIFPSYPFDVMDAAFQWQDKIYFIKGNQVYASQRNSKEYLATRPLSDWGVSDDKIDAALVSPSGKIYLFRRNHFWTLTETSNGNLKVESPLPQNTRISFLHCAQSSS